MYIYLKLGPIGDSSTSCRRVAVFHTPLHLTDGFLLAGQQRSFGATGRGRQEKKWDRGQLQHPDTTLDNDVL